MSAHAPLAPSGAHRWISCPASVRAEGGFPDTSSPEADEGSAMHEVRARCLKTGNDPSHYLDWPFFGGTRRATVATQKLLNPLVEGLERIYDICARDAGLAQGYGDLTILRAAEPRYVLIEETMRFESPALADVYGTLDFGAFLPWRAMIVLSDLKFGQGYPVYAKDNEQQLIYAGLMLDTLTRKERAKVEDILIIIDQPRIADAGGEWIVTLDYLERWIDEVLLPAVDATKDRNPKYNPGRKQCYWCKAAKANACEACADFNIRTLGISFDDERDAAALATTGLERLSPERRAHLVLHKQMIEKFLEAVYAETFADAIAGRPTPGLKAGVGRRGKREWVDEAAAVSELTPLLGEKATVTEVISPTTAADLLPRKTWVEIEKRLVTQADGKPTLVPADSPKPAVKQIEMDDEREG